MTSYEPKSFLNAAETIPVVDVRSPAEFELGHMPGAVNIPLFDNNERALIGTVYKNEGKHTAFDLGLDLTGPKMSGLVRQARQIAPSGQVLLYCWRGGMRSSSMAWLFETAGLTAGVLTGGYKAYRTYIRENLVTDRGFIILGGMTGSGKTLLLKKLAQTGEPVIDLEALAVHRGSVFGAIGLGPQPSNEQFENDLYRHIRAFSPGSLIWLEDESRQIGNVFLPEPFYQAMVSSPLVQIRIPDEMRIKIIVDEYAALDPQSLAAAIRKISKRLGGLLTQEVLEAVINKNFERAVELLLPYYDKTYSHSLNSRPGQPVYPLDLTSFPVGEYPAMLIKKKLQLPQ